MRGADDLDVEPVGVVPPIIERGRRQHRERAPHADPCAEWRTEAPEPDRARTLLGRAGEGCLECDVSARDRDDRRREVGAHVRRRPERVATDGHVPRDVPDQADDDTRRRNGDGIQIPGHPDRLLGGYGGGGDVLRKGGKLAERGRHNRRSGWRKGRVDVRQSLVGRCEMQGSNDGGAELRGIWIGVQASSPFTLTTATTRPTAAPNAARTTLSVKNNLTSRLKLAPMAARTATSCCRALARARSRFATLTPASAGDCEGRSAGR